VNNTLIIRWELDNFGERTSLTFCLQQQRAGLSDPVKVFYSLQYESQLSADHFITI